MANPIFRGDELEVAQVSRAQIDGYDGATTYGITIDGHTVSVAGNTNAATTATNLVAALNASTIRQFAEITWSVQSSDYVAGTMDTAGKPFVATSYTSGGTGTMSPTTGNTLTATTANSGKNAVNIAANWTGGANPANSDNVYFQDRTDIDAKYGLDQFAANTFTTLHVLQNFEADLGLPRINSDSTEYTEYRQTYFQSAAATIHVGSGLGDGSGRIKLDSGATNSVVVNVYNTGSPKEADIPAMLWKGTGTGVVFNAWGGSIGLAIFGGETATIGTLTVDAASVWHRSGVVTTLNLIGSGSVFMDGSGAITTINHGGTGNMTLLNTGNITTLNMKGPAGGGGEITHRGAGTVATIAIEAGTIRYEGGNIGTSLVVRAGGVIDFSYLKSAITVAACTVYAGATIRDPRRLVTWSAGIIAQCRLSEVTLDVGIGVTITPS